MAQRHQAFFFLRFALIPTILIGNNLLPLSASAQVIPDTTLPNNSVVTPQGNTFQIDGGTEVGGNLFHSFQEFSVPTGGTAFFNNTIQIRNILSRVTGGSISTIDGLIQANGTANLFLINPNGIIFGSNAMLQIGGSFLATTAHQLNFADGSFFSAKNPQSSPLLTISVPIGLQFGSIPQEIQVQGQGHNLMADFQTGAVIRGLASGLQVGSGQTLALVGGNVTLLGGNLIAESGRIEVGSVGDNSFVSLSVSDPGLMLGYEGVQRFQDIQLSQRASIDASGAGGGDIRVQGSKISLQEGSVILAITEGVNPGRILAVNAADTIELMGTSADGLIPSSLLTETINLGAAGTLTISTGNLILQDGAQASSSTFSPGKGGNLAVNALGLVEVSGTTLDGRPSGLAAATVGFAPGGNLSVNSDQLIVRNGARVTTDTLFAPQPAGNLQINTRELVVETGAQISSSTFGAGNAGDLQINASDLVEVRGVGIQEPSGIFSQVNGRPLENRMILPATGRGGKLSIATGRLIVTEGAQISAGTFGGGEGGSVNVNASELVEVGGTATNNFPSAITTITLGDRNAGNLTINTERLVVRDGGQLTASTRGAGQGGTMELRANSSVEVSGSAPDGRPSRLTVRTEGLGNAGDLRIVSERMTVRDRAEVNVNGILRNEAGETIPNALLGAAGNLEIEASQLRLNDGGLTAETTSGAQGNIIVRSRDIQLRRGSNITTNAIGTATGGNIDINTDTLVALENSDITANSVANFGGRVSIRADGILGNEFRDRTTNQSDITASSDLGAEFSGVVDLQTPDVDPSQGLVDLEADPVDVASLINQNLCAVGQGSEFTITGRGGVPASPNDPSSATTVWEDWNITEIPEQPTVVREGLSEVNFNRPSTASHPIVEAQGWVMNAQGEIVLTAQNNTVTPHQSWLKPVSCQQLNQIEAVRKRSQFSQRY